MTPMIPFHDGHAIPAFGFGVWQIPKDETVTLVRSALTQGYKLIDAAFIYENEAAVGEGFRTAEVDREDVFLTSKVWNSEQGYDKTRRAIEGSLKRMGLDYLNLCLIHWPCPDFGTYVDTWRAFIDAQKDGQVRSIGTSNFAPDHLDCIIGETGVKPVLNQIEVNPRMQQVAMRAENEKRGIVTQGWTPLGNGASFDAAVVHDIAKRTGLTPVQVILRWELQLGISVIPRAETEAQLAENLAILQAELTAEDMAAMATLEEGVRCGPAPETYHDA